jgi:hypothetical protein
VSVGLGNASREEIRANLGAMMSFQQQAAQMPGLIQAQNVYALFRRMQKELGFETENFITDPKSPEYQKAVSAPPPEDPYVTGAKIKAQSDQQGKLIDASLKSRELADDRAEAIAKLELQYNKDLAQPGIGADLRGTGQARPGSAAPSGQPVAPGGV